MLYLKHAPVMIAAPPRGAKPTSETGPKQAVLDSNASQHRLFQAGAVDAQPHASYPFRILFQWC